MTANPPSPETDARPGPLGGGLRLGRILGFEVYADWSLTLIFALVLFNLGLQVFPSWHPSWGPIEIWLTAIGAAVLFFGSVLAHELSHSLVARRQGLRVRRITLFIFGGAAQIEDEPASPKDEFLVAVVGPLTSVAIGVVALLAVVVGQGGVPAETWSNPTQLFRLMNPVETLLLWLGPINILLGVFNIIPGFPLDGGRVFRALVWWLTGDVMKATRWAAAAGQLFGWALIIFGLTNLLSGLAVQGLWLLVIGWFLNGAAGMSYQQMFVAQTLKNVRVAAVMRPDVRTVSPDVSVQVLVDEFLTASDQRTYPVVSDGLVGLVRLQDVRKIPREKWPWTRVAEIMTPRERVATLDSGAPAAAVAKTLARQDAEEIPVLENDTVVGLVQQSDLVKWMTLNPPASR